MDIKKATHKELRDHLAHQRVLTRVVMFFIAVFVPWIIAKAVIGIIWPILSFIPLYYFFKAVMLAEQVEERKVIEAWHEWQIQDREEVYEG